MEKHLLNVIANLEKQRASIYDMWEKRTTAFSELKYYSDGLEKKIAELASNLMAVRNALAEAMGQKMELRVAIAAECRRRIALEEQVKELKARKQKRAKNGKFA